MGALGRKGSKSPSPFHTQSLKFFGRKKILSDGIAAPFSLFTFSKICQPNLSSIIYVWATAIFLETLS